MAVGERENQAINTSSPMAVQRVCRYLDGNGATEGMSDWEELVADNIGMLTPEGLNENIIKLIFSMKPRRNFENILIMISEITMIHGLVLGIERYRDVAFCLAAAQRGPEDRWGSVQDCLCHLDLEIASGVEYADVKVWRIFRTVIWK